MMLEMIRTIAASDSHTNSSIYKGTSMSYFRQKNCIPKLALEIYTRFAWAGGTCPRFAWAGGTFFFSCAVVSVFGSGGKQVLVLHTYVLRVQYIQLWCCVSFWFWREIVFGVTYVLSVQYSCAVVSV